MTRKTVLQYSNDILLTKNDAERDVEAGSGTQGRCPAADEIACDMRG